MKAITQKKHTIEFIFPVVLFFVFAILALLVMLFATNIYSESVNHSLKNSSSAIATSYVSEKIHSADASGCISTGEFCDCNAIIIKDREDSNQVTYIYEYQGYLKELYTRSGSHANASDGTNIIELSSFSPSKEENQIHINCVDTDGRSSRIIVGIRSR